MANLLKLAEIFTNNPPSRSMLLVATSGHAQSLHGMRDLIWSMQERTKILRDLRRNLKKSIKQSKQTLILLEELVFPLSKDEERDRILVPAIENDLKFAIDKLSRRLMNLRLKQSGTKNSWLIEELANKRFALRRIGWMTSLHDMPPDEQTLLQEILPHVRQTLNRSILDSELQLESLQSALDFRQLTRDYTIAAILSLHLSSHGEGIGGFHRGCTVEFLT